MNLIRHFWVVFLAEFKRLAAYRVQFWFEVIVASLVELGVALTLWQSIYHARGTDLIGGYHLNEMVLYIILATFIGHAVKGTGIGTFGREIYDGSFTRYLVFPLSPFSYKFGLYFPRTCISLGQLLVILFAVSTLGLWPISFAPSWLNILQVCFSIALASYLYFLCIVSIESIAFWADNAWAVSAILQISLGLLSGKLVPIDLFPSWAQHLLAYSPFPMLVFFPVQSARGILSTSEWIGGIFQVCCWILVVQIVAIIVIRRGIRRYSGVGI